MGLCTGRSREQSSAMLVDASPAQGRYACSDPPVALDEDGDLHSVSGSSVVVTGNGSEESDTGLLDADVEEAPEDDDEARRLDAFLDDNVKRKIEVLAQMVGVEESSDVGAVLGEVVRVLRELEAARQSCCLEGRCTSVNGRHRCKVLFVHNQARNKTVIDTRGRPRHDCEKKLEVFASLPSLHQMACISFLGCSRAPHSHESVGSYMLIALAIAGIIMGLRILLHVVARAMYFLRHRSSASFSSSSSSSAEEEEVEMQIGPDASTAHRHQQQWSRREAIRSPLPCEEWHSKLVIMPGFHHASLIAHPCPLRST